MFAISPLNFFKVDYWLFSDRPKNQAGATRKPKKPQTFKVGHEVKILFVSKFIAILQAMI